jgi:hypothetical protein
VTEAKLGGMQKVPIQCAKLTGEIPAGPDSVNIISDDGMANSAQVHTNLVSPARLDSNLEQ